MSAILKRLEEEGYRYSFFQAVKLLEDAFSDRPGIGHLGPYDQEAVHIRPSVELSFSPADVCRIERTETEDGKDLWNLFENFLGLYGPNSAAPIFIAEIVAQCPHDEDALRDFLDIFNHRILSLYYRAWKKVNLAACVSRERDDPISVALCALAGRDVQTPSDGWIVAPERLLLYSSHFCSSSRPASGLENLLSDYFELENVHIIQFVSRRFKPSAGSDHCRVGGPGDCGRLGESFVLGETINDVAGQFKIRLDSLEMKQFLRFQPGEPAFDELVFLTNLYVRYQLDFSLELVLKPNQGRPVYISCKEPTGVLGRSAWIGFPTEKETVVTLEVDSGH